MPRFGCGAPGGGRRAAVGRESAGVAPEKALLELRKELGLFANLRPAMLFEGMEQSSTLRPEVLKGVDLIVVRELTGGIYSGKRAGDR